MDRSAWCVVVLVMSLAAAASAQGRLKPTSPEVVVDTPAWSGTIQLADGRTFVSEGGFAIDAAIARPTALPKTVLPAASAKALAGHLGRSNPREVGLADLKPSSKKNTLVTADGVGINGNYLSFLRRVAPSARLRTDGPRDPIVVVVDGRAVGVFMPVVLPEPPR